MERGKLWEEKIKRKQIKDGAGGGAIGICWAPTVFVLYVIWSWETRVFTLNRAGFENNEASLTPHLRPSTPRPFASGESLEFERRIFPLPTLLKACVEIILLKRFPQEVWISQTKNNPLSLSHPGCIARWFRSKDRHVFGPTCDKRRTRREKGMKKEQLSNFLRNSALSFCDALDAATKSREKQRRPTSAIGFRKTARLRTLASKLLNRFTLVLAARNWNGLGQNIHDEGSYRLLKKKLGQCLLSRHHNPGRRGGEAGKGLRDMPGPPGQQRTETGNLTAGEGFWEQLSEATKSRQPLFFSPPLGESISTRFELANSCSSAPHIEGNQPLSRSFLVDIILSFASPLSATGFFRRLTLRGGDVDSIKAQHRNENQYRHPRVSTPFLAYRSNFLTRADAASFRGRETPGNPPPAPHTTALTNSCALFGLKSRACRWTCLGVGHLGEKTFRPGYLCGSYDMEQRHNEDAGGTRDPRENPLASSCTIPDRGGESKRIETIFYITSYHNDEKFIVKIQKIWPPRGRMFRMGLNLFLGNARVLSKHAGYMQCPTRRQGGRGSPGNKYGTIVFEDTRADLNEHPRSLPSKTHILEPEERKLAVASLIVVGSFEEYG
ncbi:hypothetical protein PR048_005802 [Dryococelus australis]|uniref:Uncharacterized protein n=1 Tax=Dryococelus australis TaxID=614101 RepID=A0ABQ9I991_9NEOP|nr:hypothetical protein PR048_005802 [Dryococelus australis]